MSAILLPVGVLAVLAAVFGLLLGFAALRLAPREDTLIERINDLLPQTQCGQCGYPGCRPYAAAIACGEVGVDRCPPGGDATANALAALLGRPAAGLDPQFRRPDGGQDVVAWIDEERCVGCALCIEACPVDAIAGAPKYMHTIIAAECTGCELCVPPCPVDCIELRPRADAAGPLRQPRRRSSAEIAA